MQLTTTTSPALPNFTISGDPFAGTRLAGRDQWQLDLTPRNDQAKAYSSLDAAVAAARSISAHRAPTVAVVQVKDGYAVLQAELGTGPQAVADLNGTFDLFRQLEVLGRGGYLGSPDKPQTALVALVDGDNSAHITDTGSFGAWGFVDGLPTAD